MPGIYIDLDQFDDDDIKEEYDARFGGSLEAGATKDLCDFIVDNVKRKDIRQDLRDYVEEVSGRIMIGV